MSDRMRPDSSSLLKRTAPAQDAVPSIVNIAKRHKQTAQGIESPPDATEAKDKFDLFVQDLTKSVLSYRCERLLRYQLQREERQNRAISRDLDAARTKLERARAFDYERKKPGTLRQCQNEITRRNPDFRKSLVAVRTLRVNRERAEEEMRAAARRVYEYDIDEVKTLAGETPDRTPKLSPVFFTRLRIGKMGSLLLDQDESFKKETQRQTQRSLSMMTHASWVTQRHIEGVEAGPQPSNGDLHQALRSSMGQLGGQIRAHRENSRAQEHAEARAGVRCQLQIFWERTLFLETAGPLLEVEKLVDRDRVKSALVETEISGEPVLYANAESTELTRAQRLALVDELEIYENELKKRKAIQAAMSKEEFEEAWCGQKLQDDGANRVDFHRRWWEDEMVAAEMVLEAEEKEREVLNILLDTGGVTRPYDFVDQFSDGAADSESCVQRQQRLDRVDHNAVERWLEDLLRRKDKVGAARPPEWPAVDYWHAKPVAVDDNHRFEPPELSADAAEWRAKLLQRHKIFVEETRDEMSVFQEEPEENSNVDSDSEYQVCYCC